eukprot:626978_1
MFINNQGNPRFDDTFNLCPIFTYTRTISSRSTPTTNNINDEIVKKSIVTSLYSHRTIFDDLNSMLVSYLSCFDHSSPTYVIFRHTNPSQTLIQLTQQPIHMIVLYNSKSYFTHHYSSFDLLCDANINISHKLTS